MCNCVGVDRDIRYFSPGRLFYQGISNLQSIIILIKKVDVMVDDFEAIRVFQSLVSVQVHRGLRVLATHEFLVFERHMNPSRRSEGA